MDTTATLDGIPRAAPEPLDRAAPASVARPTDLTRPAPVPRPLVDIVIPVYDEERELETNVLRLRRYLDTEFPFPAIVTIADNASTDSTWEIATRLRETLGGVRAIHLTRKGRGRALGQAWLASEAPVLAYMDVDLATDLNALLPLVAPLLSGHSQLSIGSRLASGAHVERGRKREFISRCYNLILRATLRIGVRDAQCGFKAIRSDAAQSLLPGVRDTAWFFDTELLVLARRAGLRISEIPVDWTDDPDSRVHIVSTALADLRGVARLLRDGARPELDGSPLAGDGARPELDRAQLTRPLFPATQE